MLTSTKVHKFSRGVLCCLFGTGAGAGFGLLNGFVHLHPFLMMTVVANWQENRPLKNPRDTLQHLW